MNGLWIAHFDAGAAHGNGLAVFREGEVLGGDFAHTWTGTYEEEGQKLYARIRVAPYVPQDETAPRLADKPMMVTLRGRCTDNNAVLEGRADESDVPVNIEMHKAA